MAELLAAAAAIDGSNPAGPEIGDQHLRRILPSLTALAFLLPIVLLYWQIGGPSGLLADPSTGVHVRTGQWILAHHAVPRYDLFSFTLPHKRWCDWEWLSDVLFAEAYRVNGLSAAAALALVLLCVVSLMVYRTARQHAGPVVAASVCSLVMATNTIHWLARPHLFTWLALAAVCWLLERNCGPKHVLTLGGIMAIWVNVHPGFVAGFLVLGACLAGSAIGWRLGINLEDQLACRRRARWYGLAIVVCVAATFVNPYGPELHRHILSYLLSPSTVTVHVQEWLSPDFHNLRLAWFEVLLPLAAAAGVWHGLKRRFYWCLLIFGFMHLALVSVRNVPLFAIVCAAPLAAAGEEVLGNFKFWQGVQAAEVLASKASRRCVTTAVFALGFAGVVAVGVSPVTLGEGSGIPVAAIQHLPEGRLFTTDHWADYLILAQPGQKVFFDGRNDFYGPAFVESYVRVMRAEPGWEKILNKYHVLVVLVPADTALSAALGQDAAWMAEYQSPKATVFVRKPEMSHDYRLWPAHDVK